jgi:organic hydroperoxide reductase OsmC/OhrA
MVPPFPHHCQVSLSRTDSFGTLDAREHPSIVGGPPPGLGGGARVWSPEELLLSSASLGVMTTFQAYAAKERLPIGIYRCVSEGTLEEIQGRVTFTRIVLRVDLTVAISDLERAEKVLQAAKRDCVISRTLNLPVELESTVRESRPT